MDRDRVACSSGPTHSRADVGVVVVTVVISSVFDDGERIAKVFTEVLAERIRQAERFGDREDHPSIDPTLLWGRTKGELNTETAIHQAAQRYEIPTAARARTLRERSTQVSWPAIIVEELAESVEAAIRFGDGPLLRAEIVQVVATCVAWLENLDRRD